VAAIPVRIANRFCGHPRASSPRFGGQRRREMSPELVPGSDEGGCEGHENEAGEGKRSR
jgi:hypothetical protein